MFFPRCDSALSDIPKERSRNPCPPALANTLCLSLELPFEFVYLGAQKLLEKGIFNPLWLAPN